MFPGSELLPNSATMSSRHVDDNENAPGPSGEREIPQIGVGLAKFYGINTFKNNITLTNIHQI